VISPLRVAQAIVFRGLRGRQTTKTIVCPTDPAGTRYDIDMRIGIFGLGFMGATHLRACRRIPAAEVVAVVSNDPRSLAGDLSSVQGNFGAPGEKTDFSGAARYADPFDALKNPEIEAVDLCLPTNLHAPVAIAALQAGKHVLVEKPMALTGEECGRVLDAAAEAGRILMVAQVLRFMPAYAAAAHLVKSGELGPVRSAAFRRRTGVPGWSQWLTRKEQSGGAVLDLLVHDLDFCIHLFGLPEAVSASGYEDLARGLDFASAQMHYPSAASVTVSGGWYHPHYPFSMEFTIAGDGGTLEFGWAGVPSLVFYRASGEAQPLALPEDHAFEAEIGYFVDCAAAGRQPELCPPAESAAAIWLANLIAESRRRGGERIACRP
jgi:predicted dehydrogenase